MGFKARRGQRTEERKWGGGKGRMAVMRKEGTLVRGMHEDRGRVDEEGGGGEREEAGGGREEHTGLERKRK